MEAFIAILDIVQKVLVALGIGGVGLGAYQYFDGHKSDNSADKKKGFDMMIGSAGITLIGQAVIPLITAALQ